MHYLIPNASAGHARNLDFRVHLAVFAGYTYFAVSIILFTVAPASGLPVNESTAQPSSASPEIPNAPASREAAPPWVILVCADLGYLSVEPQAIMPNAWDEFMTASGAIIRGSVYANDDIPTIELNHPLSSMAELDTGAFERSLKHIDAMAKLETVLDAALSATTTIEQARSTVRAITAAGSYGARAIAFLDSANGVIDRESVAHLTAELKAARRTELQRCLAQPFVNARRSGWKALSYLVSVAGRSSSVSILVCSAPRAQMADALGGALALCAGRGLAPDLVVWDYATAITMEDMKLLARVAQHAGDARTLVTVSLDDTNTVIEAATDTDALRTAIRSDHAIPLRRLRRNPASRHLLLCGPVLRLAGDDHFDARCGAGWLVALSLTRSFIDGVSPMLCTVPSQEDLDRHFQFTLPEDRLIAAQTAVEAHRAGLILLCAEPPEERLGLRTLYDSTIDTPGQSHAGALLLQNRLTHLCSARLAHTLTGEISEGVLSDIRDYVQTILGPMRVDAAERTVRAGKRDRTVWIEASFDRSPGAVPIRIEIET